MDEAARYRELDLVRGIAILMMILFHTVFDLYFFRILPVDIYSGFWRYFAFATASLFLLIVGISLTISRARISKIRLPAGIKIRIPGSRHLYSRASCHVLHLAVPQGRFHRFWYPAPYRYFRHDLPALFPV